MFPAEASSSASRACRSVIRSPASVSTADSSASIAAEYVSAMALLSVIVGPEEVAVSGWSRRITYAVIVFVMLAMACREVMLPSCPSSPIPSTSIAALPEDGQSRFRLPG